MLYISFAWSRADPLSSLPLCGAGRGSTATKWGRRCRGGSTSRRPRRGGRGGTRSARTWVCASVGATQGGLPVVYVPYDFSRVRVLDLSQNFSIDSPAFAYYEGPTVKWVKRLAFEGVNAQLISSTNHISTHLDSPIHFYDPGPDIAGIPLETLFGPACIVDLSQFGIGDYQIYGSEHFERWERETGIKIERGDILVIHTGYHHWYNEDWYKVHNQEK